MISGKSPPLYCTLTLKQGILFLAVSGMFGHGFDKPVNVFYAGKIQNPNCRRLEMATYFCYKG